MAGKSLVPQVETLANELSSNWTMAEACKALEVTRYQLKQLLDAKIILALQTPDRLNRDWVINKDQCLLLVEQLRAKARKKDQPVNGVSMDGIQRKGYSIVQLVLAMRSGKLQYSLCSKKRQSSSLKGFTAFTVSS